MPLTIGQIIDSIPSHNQQLTLTLLTTNQTGVAMSISEMRSRFGFIAGLAPSFCSNIATTLREEGQLEELQVIANNVVDERIRAIFQ